MRSRNKDHRSLLRYLETAPASDFSKEAVEDVVQQPCGDGVKYLLGSARLLVDVCLISRRLDAFGLDGTVIRSFLCALGRGKFLREFWCRHFFLPRCKRPCALFTIYLIPGFLHLIHSVMNYKPLLTSIFPNHK
ncbi:hypothetical protein B6A09_0515 [Saccharomyces cerevisiae synthetic construct]|uniref:Putative uncharacterized protein YBL012C n=1 Tax=Saccharomyces cerevisiae (strain ATCC 204508 / S288c) TaxID=559292 RepID=YBB2_YEAST|nr:RecName: Full=Putative uncharacterized protein YBL012C [Saccharomyces cerevisiae S288C]ARB01778.1 hypothetical protein B6A09_0515 [Saccharomyces cerevisiae synthetic construct]WNV71875.1 hypothetical protein O6U65_0103 [Saccharomyces cerevisiae synthetic construct]CAA84830.1 unnamed protein product [Saccharomyces cerevisiae]